MLDGDVIHDNEKPLWPRALWAPHTIVKIIKVDKLLNTQRLIKATLVQKVCASDIELVLVLILHLCPFDVAVCVVIF